MEVRQDGEGGVDEPDEDEGQRDDHGQEEPLFAAFGVRELGAGKEGGEGEGDVRDDEEDDADFGGGLYMVGAVRAGAVAASDDAEDQADGDEELDQAEVDGAEGKGAGFFD